MPISHNRPPTPKRGKSPHSLREQLYHRLSHLLAGAIFAFILLIVAVGFTYVEDWIISHNRPHWLCMGCTGITILLFVVDGIVITSMVLKFAFEAVIDLYESIRALRRGNIGHPPTDTTLGAEKTETPDGQ
jgi:hypothetical protein